MSLDQPASSAALWSIFDATGIRPEWLLPGLDIESGLNPSLPNLQGYHYYGINQISGTFLSSISVSPGDYLTWPASRQLSTVVKPYMANEVKSFGPLLSGVRVYQANFYPASLKTATRPNDPIVCKPNRPCHSSDPDPYCANVVLDYNKDGCITPSDLAVLVGQHAKTARVQQGIASAYAMRPGEQPTDPVWGNSRPSLVASLTRTDWALIAAAAATLAAGVYVAKEEGVFRRLARA